MSETSEFQVVANLLAIVSDPAASKKRLSDLERQIETLAKLQTKVDNDRASHERTTAADKASAAEREKTLRDREVSVAIKERNLVAREKAIADARPPRFSDDPNLNPGGRSYSGLSREAAHG
jgi:uncharacterized protein YgiM (DUF1202 family)